ncbi:MAG: inositol monophosphatase family protein [Prochlorothrix sp.]|nr:inositol monophosphatase family protein [Prochlorothrix sp.]
MPDPSLSYAQERDVALHCTIAAARLCEAVRQDQASVAIHKPDHSPVTVADYGAQALICRSLQAAFPHDPVMGEEDAQLLASPELTECRNRVTEYVCAQLQTPVETETVLDWIGHGRSGFGDRFWTLDPIDGTKGYVRGDQYAVALALIEQGQLQVAAIVAPALPVDSAQPTGDRGVAFVAVRGQGAEAIALGSGARRVLRVNGAAQRDRFRLIESVERDHGTPAWQQAVATAIGLTVPAVQMDSLAKYGSIARGEADLYLRLPSGDSVLRWENIWDHGAGVLVLEEAGGTVTDQTGKPLDFSQGTKLLKNRGIVASNGVIHGAAIEAIRALGID